MIFVGISIYVTGLFTGSWHLIARLAVKMLLIAFFPLILYFFNFYEPIEIERLRQFWQKWRNPLNWGKNISKIKLN